MRAALSLLAILVLHASWPVWAQSLPAPAHRDSALIERTLSDIAETIVDARRILPLPAGAPYTNLYSRPQASMGAPLCSMTVLSIPYNATDGSAGALHSELLYRLAQENDGQTEKTSGAALADACAQQSPRDAWFTAPNEPDTLAAIVWFASGLSVALSEGHASFDGVDLVEWRRRHEAEVSRMHPNASPLPLASPALPPGKAINKIELRPCESESWSCRMVAITYGDCGLQTQLLFRLKIEPASAGPTLMYRASDLSMQRVMCMH